MRVQKLVNISTLILSSTGLVSAVFPAIFNRELLPSISVDQACNELASLSPNSTLLPGSDKYPAEIINHWDKRGNLIPACVFMPADAKEVSDAITIIHRNQAQFAVRGGGHMNVS